MKRKGKDIRAKSLRDQWVMLIIYLEQHNIITVNDILEFCIEYDGE